MTAFSLAIKSNSGLFSIIYRGFFLFTALFLLLKNFTITFQSKLLSVSIFFWTLYISRFLYDVFHIGIEGPRDSFTLTMFLFGGAIPAFLVPFSLSHHRSKYFFKWINYFVLIQLVLFVFVIGSLQSILQESIFNSGRVHVDALNTITLGHIGVSIFFIYFWEIFDNNNKTWLNFVLILLGLLIMLVAGSRGPVISFIAIFGFILFLNSSSILSYLKYVIITLAFSFATYSISISLSEDFNLKTFDRLFKIFNQDITVEHYSSGRLNSYSKAFQQFIDNPLLGSAYVELESNFYPHNILVESFMAVGVLGGSAFLLLIISGLYYAYKLAKRDIKFALFSYFYIHRTTAVLFSGSIYFSIEFWFCLGIMLAWGTRLNSNTISFSEI